MGTTASTVAMAKQQQQQQQQRFYDSDDECRTPPAYPEACFAIGDEDEDDL